MKKECHFTSRQTFLQGYTTQTTASATTVCSTESYVVLYTWLDVIRLLWINWAVCLDCLSVCQKKKSSLKCLGTLCSLFPIWFTVWWRDEESGFLSLGTHTGTQHEKEGWRKMGRQSIERERERRHWERKREKALREYTHLYSGMGKHHNWNKAHH